MNRVPIDLLKAQKSSARVGFKESMYVPNIERTAASNTRFSTKAFRSGTSVHLSRDESVSMCSIIDSWKRAVKASRWAPESPAFTALCISCSIFSSCCVDDFGCGVWGLNASTRWLGQPKAFTMMARLLDVVDRSLDSLKYAMTDSGLETT